MTKNSKTKRALLMSILSLVICLSMLIGTTFAWFTDSVTSGKNTILAGNLDVDMYYKNAATADAADGWASIKDAEDLFTDENGNAINWEPGVVTLTQFKVSNLGSLALKYQFMTDATYNYVAETNYNLTDVIKVGIIKGTVEDDLTREDAIALIDNWDDDIKAFQYVNAMNPEVSDYFTVVLYWEPTASDNNWNVKDDKYTAAEANSAISDENDALYLDVSITLLATQAVSEYDSFDNKYDLLADGTPAWDGVDVTSVTLKVNSGEMVLPFNIAPVSGENTTVTFADGALVDATAENNKGETVTVTPDTITLKLESTDAVVTSADESFDIFANGDTAVAAIDLVLTDEDGNTITNFNESVTVKTRIAKGLTNVVLKYKDEVIASTYDPATGDFSFVTDHFSEFVVFADETAYNTTTATAYADPFKAIYDADAGDRVALLQNIDKGNSYFTITVPNDVTFDLNSHVITSSSDYGTMRINLSGILHIVDGSENRSGAIVNTCDLEPHIGDITVTDFRSCAAVYVPSYVGGGKLVIDDIALRGTENGAALAIGKTGESVTVNSGSIDGGIYFYRTSATNEVAINIANGVDGISLDDFRCFKPETYFAAVSEQDGYKKYFADALPDNDVEILTSAGAHSTYNDLKSAFNSTSFNYTIKMLRDVTVDNSLGITFTSRNNILDLNGKSITISASNFNGMDVTNYTNSPTVVIKDSSDTKSGTIKSIGNSTGCLEFNNYSSWGKYVDLTATIESGNFVAEKGAVLTFNNTFSTINGGTFTATGNFQSIYINNDASVTVNGGEFNGKVDVNNGFLTINGGTFNGTISMSPYNGCTIDIYGGTFSVDPSTITNATIHGDVVDNGNGTFTVVAQ